MKNEVFSMGIVDIYGVRPKRYGHLLVMGVSHELNIQPQSL